MSNKVSQPVARQSPGSPVAGKKRTRGAVCAALLRGKTAILIIGLQSGAAIWRHRLSSAKGP
jgi:hypothetical protein